MRKHGMTLLAIVLAASMLAPSITAFAEEAPEAEAVQETGTETEEVYEAAEAGEDAAVDLSDIDLSDIDLDVAIAANIAAIEAEDGETRGDEPLFREAASGFSDVSRSDFYYDYVNWMVDLGITQGWPDGTFRPLNGCNRASVVTFLWRLDGCPEPSSTANYSDMTGNSDFDKAISWASEMNITTGYSDGTFRPWATCNRASIVTFLWRYAGRPMPSSTATFKDMTSNSDFNNAISWASEYGITTGYSDNTFRPWATCNRLAVASFLYRYAAPGYQKLKDIIVRDGTYDSSSGRYNLRYMHSDLNAVVFEYDPSEEYIYFHMIDVTGGPETVVTMRISTIAQTPRPAAAVTIKLTSSISAQGVANINAASYSRSTDVSFTLVNYSTAYTSAQWKELLSNAFAMAAGEWQIDLMELGLRLADFGFYVYY